MKGNRSRQSIVVKQKCPDPLPLLIGWHFARQDDRHSEQMPIGVFASDVRQWNQSDMRPLTLRPVWPLAAEPLWSGRHIRRQNCGSQLRSDLQRRFQPEPPTMLVRQKPQHDQVGVEHRLM